MSNSTKILFVITQGHWGGAQKYVHDLALGLKERKMEVKVAVGEPEGKKDLQKKMENGGVKVLQLKNLVRPINPLKDFLAVFELAKLYKKEKPQTVYLNSSKAGVLGSLAKLLLPAEDRPQIIYTVHGWAFLEPVSALKRAIYFHAEKLTVDFKDKIIVLSDKEYGIARDELDINENKLVKVLHGLKREKILSKEEAFGLLREKVKNLPKGKVIGTISGFYPTKGLDLLISAFAVVAKEKEINLVMVGEGPDKRNIEEQVNKLGLQNKVFLTGYIEDAQGIIPAFDLFVLPSRKEGYPYVILEAAAAGVPVVATKVGGVPEIISDHKEGILVESENVSELVCAIEYALKHEDELKKMALALQEKTSALGGWDKMLAKTVEVGRVKTK